MFCYSCLFANSIPYQNIPHDFECVVMQTCITQITLSLHPVTLFLYSFSDLDMRVFQIRCFLIESRNCVISQMK